LKARAFHAVIAALASATCAMAVAAEPTAAQRYQQERKACISGNTGQDRATCLKEASAALQEAKRDQLAAGRSGDLERNRLARCDAVPSRDQTDCLMRMSESGTASGSVRNGGVLREATRPVPAR
jgi:hypothetical protein